MIIALVGKKGSGKTELKDYIVNTYKLFDYSFAFPIKEACRIIFNFSTEQLYYDKKEIIDKRYGVTPREIIQYIGTDIFQFDLPDKFPKFEKKIGRNFWVNKFIEQYNPKAKYIIDDLRFVHESDELRKLKNCFIIKINRNNNKNKDNHLSETELDVIDFDYCISNNNTIEYLYRNFDYIYSEIINKIK